MRRTIQIVAGALLPVLCCTALAAQESARPSAGLGDLAQRLDMGDRSAIEDLLARTRPSAIDLVDSNVRLAALRAEVERLDARRRGRPVLAPSSAKPLSRGSAANPGEGSIPGRVEALRESKAWLRAGDAERALRALPDRDPSRPDEDEALYVEARALEKLGRHAEALDTYRRVVASAASPLLSKRAESGVAHLEWRERLIAARKAGP